MEDWEIKCSSLPRVMRWHDGLALNAEWTCRRSSGVSAGTNYVVSPRLQRSRTIVTCRSVRGWAGVGCLPFSLIHLAERWDELPYLKSGRRLSLIAASLIFLTTATLSDTSKAKSISEALRPKFGSSILFAI